MTAALSLTIRRPIDVMGVVTQFFAGESDREIVFEGDISAIDWATIPGATVPQDRSFAVVPLSRANSDILVASVFPRIGLRSRVSHVIVRKGNERIFASYDWFEPGSVVIEAPERDLLCAELQAAGLVLDQKEVD